MVVQMQEQYSRLLDTGMLYLDNLFRYAPSPFMPELRVLKAAGMKQIPIKAPEADIRIHLDSMKHCLQGLQTI